MTEPVRRFANASDLALAQAASEIVDLEQDRRVLREIVIAALHFIAGQRVEIRRLREQLAALREELRQARHAEGAAA